MFFFFLNRSNSNNCVAYDRIFRLGETSLKNFANSNICVRDMKRYYGIRNLSTGSPATSILNTPYGYSPLV